MRWIIAHTNAFGLLLIVSLAFNVGFGATFGVRTLHHAVHGTAVDGGGHFSSLHQKLGLSQEQRDDVKMSGDKLFDQIYELRSSLRMETDALADLITSDAPDPQLLAHHLERMGHVRSMIERHALEHFLEVRGHLREDQRSDFDEMIRTHVLQYNGFSGQDEESAHGPHSGRPSRFGHGDEHGHTDHP